MVADLEVALLHTHDERRYSPAEMDPFVQDTLPSSFATTQLCEQSFLHVQRPDTIGE